MSRIDETSVGPWPGDPSTAWAAVEGRVRTHRLSDRPEAIPRMDDLSTRLRLRKHPSNAAVATILLGGAGVDRETVRMDGQRAIRIVSACERWATQLEADPEAYAEFWRRWKREDPEVLPSELLFGSEAAGGFITCVDRHHCWFLVIPHRRKVRLGNSWHHAHTLPVWWTTEHADSIGIDWGSMRAGS
ncbi:hypothetical protein ACWDTP_10670 [Mycobacterium sp. NPDC003449]